jgi:hypothetical protein
MESFKLTIEDYELYIGKKCKKKSVAAKVGGNPYQSKPFKSGAKINTIKGVINHPHLNVPAYVFHEDDSHVECRRVEILD